MFRIMTAALLLGVLGPRAETPEHWQYAGENHGIRFFFKIANECRESGASVAVKLESTLDYPVTVSFRLNDPNWSKIFERDLTPGEKDSGLKFTPGEGTACHPFVDEVFVDTKETQVTKTGSGSGGPAGAE